MLPRAYAVFELQPDDPPFRPVEAVRAAAMLRSLLCRPEHRQEFAANFRENPEVYLAGHVRATQGTPPRFSYLPLPAIGCPRADGMIRRLLIAEPPGGGGQHARWVGWRLRHQTLIDHNGRARGVLLEPWGPDSPWIIGRYVGESRVWASVTPVVLPGHDDFGAVPEAHAAPPLKAERLFFRALTQAGIPQVAVSTVTLRKAPFWPGAQDPRQYHRPNYLQGYSAWHAEIAFHEPVQGPLAIGAGRHCGLGVLAAAV